MDKINQTLLNILRYGVYFILFIPFFVSKHFFFPFISLKVFLFRMAVEILAVIWLYLIFKKVIKLPRFNLLAWAILAHVLVLLATVFAGLGWYRSWWGTIQRGDGLFTFLHYLVFFFILISVFQEKKYWDRLMDLFLLSSLLVGLYAVAQRFSLDIVYDTGLERATGSAGNAAHLASFLIFPFFLSLVKVFEDGFKINLKKGFYFLVLIISFLGISFSQTRGAMIGLVLGLGAFLFLFAILHKNKRIKIAGISTLVILVGLIGFVFINKDKSFIKDNLFIVRFTEINFEAETARQRLYNWRAGLKAFQKRPLLGWGMDNYNVAYNKYFDANYLNDFRTGTYNDRAHNILIELMATTGLAGLITYLFIGLLVYYYLLKFYRKNKEEIAIFVGLASLFLAYFIQNLLVFDTVITYLALFFLLGYIYKLSDGFKEAEFEKPVNLSYGRQILMIFLAIISAYLIMGHNIRPAKAAYYARQALNEAEKSVYRYANFAKLMRQSLSYQTEWDSEYLDSYTTTYKNFRDDEKADKEAIASDAEYMAAAGERALKKIKNDSKFYFLMAGIYEVIYDNNRDQEALTRAEELIKKSIDLSDQRVYSYQVLAQIYEFDGRDKEAILVLEKALELNPRIGETYWGLAIMYSKLNDNGKVIENVKKAVDNELDLRILKLQDIADILPIFEQKQDFQIMIYLYNRAIQLDPENADYLAKLAGTYAALGQNEKAVETAQKIILISPAAAGQVNQFILDVEAGKYLKKE